MKPDSNLQDSGPLLPILDMLLVGVVIIDPVSRSIVYANPQAAIMLGRSAPEMIGRICHEYICPAATGRCPIMDLGQDIDHSERCVIDRSGEQVPILKSVKKICFNGRDHLLETFMDISAYREKERLRGVLEMAGAAAHHLNQPIQVILTCAELLGRQSASADERRDLSARIQRATASVSAIMERIQSITRYRTEAYIQGKRIVDIHKSSSCE